MLAGGAEIKTGMCHGRQVPVPYLIISVSPWVGSWSPVVDTDIPILYIRTSRLRELSDLLIILKLEEAEWTGP